MAKFLFNLKVMRYLPVQALRGMAESIRSAELEKALRALGDGLTKKQLRAVEELSRGIMNKLLHKPMEGLRCDGASASAVSETLANMEALERMYQLSRFLAEGSVVGGRGR